KLMAPLSDDSDILEVRQADPSESTDDLLDSDPQVTFEREDYRKVAPREDVEELEPEILTLEAKIVSPDFRPYEKWRIQTKESTRQAIMADDEFQKRFNNGMEIHEDDIFEVTIREDAEIKNGRRNTEWTIINIRIKSRSNRGGGEDDEI